MESADSEMRRCLEEESWKLKSFLYTTQVTRKNKKNLVKPKSKKWSIGKEC
ncbi:hypothetical protein CAEBREN_29893 [Caenorhabditis brenneri]|uniref:Uncharacterized protein n=1 Tax=Caenorhabditis brenneri TaxID=135651 RepID=G0NB00_CAEBE|nr:hypothetical protein CAEBREN_29893 [Caenorhabditis brenneri]